MAKYDDNNRIGELFTSKIGGKIMRKKHSFKLTLLVLVLVLCFSTVVLAACNKGDDKDGNNNNKAVEMETSAMLSQIVEKIGNSMSFGESFVTDISAAAIIDDKTTANKDVIYRLTAKGNINGKKDAKETDTDFLIELVEEKGESKKTILGLGYEFIETEPFFFVSIAGSKYNKINGYSLASLYALTQKDTATVAAGNGIVDMVIGMLIPVLVGQTGTLENNVYIFDFNLADTVNSLLSGEIGTLLLPILEGMGIDLNTIIASLNISFKDADGQTVVVEDTATLVRFFNEAMHITGKFTVRFDNNDKFDGANFNFDYKYENADTNFQLDIEKVRFGAAEPIATFDGFALTAEQRKTAQAFNALNFSLKGSAVGTSASGSVDHRYTIEIQSDVDAFELFNLLVNGTSKENILATLEKLGYFHLEINEVDKNDTNVVVQNMITLHSKFDEGFAVLNFHGYKMGMLGMGAEVGIGGVYDFDALIDVIGMMGENNDSSDSGNTNILDTITNVIDIVKDMIGYFTFDNIAENGVTVAIKDLVFAIAEMAGLDTSDSMTSIGIGALIGTTFMNIKLETPTFGTCTTVDTDTIGGNIRNAKAYTNGKKDLIKEIVSLDGSNLKFLQNDAYLNSAKDKASILFGKAFPITGKNLKGETVTTDGFIMGAKGLNLNTVGQQKVTLYVAVANDMLDLLTLVGMSLDNLIPLSGVLKFETTVEVVAYDNQAITADNLKASDSINSVLLDSKDNVVLDIIRTNVKNPAYLTVDGIGTRTIDASMIKLFDKAGNDVTKKAYDGKKVTAVGEYTVKIVQNKVVAECGTIKAETIRIERADKAKELESIALGGTWTLSDYVVTMVDSDGKETTRTLSPVSYKMGSTTITTKLADYFDIDGNKYTLKKNLSYGGQSFKVNYGKVTTASGLSQTIEIDIPVEADYSIKKAIGLTYFMQPISAQIVYDGVEYTLVYKSGKWVGVADGKADLAIDFSMTWQSGKTPIEFNADGSIKNYINEYKTGSRQNKADCAITIGEYTYSGTITVYEIYTSDKSMDKGALDVTINSLSGIPYSGEGKLVFKYGAQGFGLYDDKTNVKVYDVKVTATKDGKPYTIVNGEINELGVYKIEYDITIDGCNQKFFHTVTVKYTGIKYIAYTANITVNDYLGNIAGIDTVDDGTLEFKYGTDGYGIYNVQGEKVYDAVVAVTLNNAAYELTDGKITAAGTYRVKVSITIEGVLHEVTYNAKVTE